MPNADGSDQGMFPQGEWVELLNTGSSAVSLEGWTIVDVGGWTHPINESSWISFAALASVLAKIIKGTSIISAASLAAFRFFIMVCVGTNTFPPI